MHIAAFISVMLALLGLVHIVVYKTFISIFAIASPHELVAMRALFVVLWLSFISAAALSFKYNNFFTRLWYKFSTIWLGFLLYFFFAGVLFALVFFTGQHVAPDVSLLWVGKVLMVGAIMVSGYGLWNAQRIQITEYMVHIPNLPQAWLGKKAVFISDMHLGQIKGKQFAANIVEKIQALHPDIIFNTGDLYDGVKVDETDSIEPIKNLKAPMGSYFVTGNHEEFRDNTPYVTAIRNAGITVLENEKVDIHGVQIVGVGYKDSDKAEDFTDVLNEIPIDTSKPSILLKHVPLNLEIAKEKGISLQLSGHTHQAQVFPFSLLTHSIYKGFDYGLHSLESMYVLTTSGVGTWGPPFRVGTKSEIVVIIFQ